MKIKPDTVKQFIARNAVWYGIAGIAAAIDLVLKHFAEKQYKGEKNVPLHFREVIHNSGFSAERLKQHPGVVALVASVFTTIIAVGIPFLKDDRKKFGWSLILGGALSNTLDRVRNRYVVDYLPHGKYVYNAGDLEIYTGAAIITAAELIEKSPENK